MKEYPTREEELQALENELKNRDISINKYKSNVINDLKKVKDISEITTIKKVKKSFIKKVFSLFK